MVLRLSTALALVALAASTAGCRRAKAERRALEAPPYTVTAPNELRVRSDLFAVLAFREVSSAVSHATIRGFGRVAFAPNGAYAVRSSVAGFVERVHVSVGQEVQPGQRLATIRSSEIAKLRADARRLEVTIATDQDIVARLDKLVSEGAASSRELVEAKGRLDAERAEYAGIREALAAVGALAGSGERFDLRASAPGRVVARRVAAGERLAPDASEPAFLIGDPRQLVVRAAFPERDVPRLVDGGACRFQVPALGATEFEGTLANIVRAIDAKTHTADALCVPKAGDPRLSADMTAKIEASVASDGAVLVPRSAVLLRRDERVVFVKAGDGVLHRRPVRLGSNVGEDVQILEGLASGEQVVIQNAVLLDGELDQVL